MLVAGDASKGSGLTIDPNTQVERLKLHRYGMPLPADGSSPAKLLVNDQFFTTNNILDTKIAEFQFLNGCLYALYDNDRMIRAFRHDGTVAREYPLPVAVTHFVRSLLFCSLYDTRVYSPIT